MLVELFKYTNAHIRHWTIETRYDENCLYIRHGVFGGAMQLDIEHVDINNSGRDIEEQMDLRANARIKSKMDIGYRLTIEESKAALGNNTIGFHRPMLAKRIENVRDINYETAYLQAKYDGHRCLVTRTSNGLVAYSRNGRVIKTIDHILSGIFMPVGMTIDGELYHHGSSLQTITSWVKRKQAGTNNLEYIVYDIVSNNGYEVRYNMLCGLSLGRFATPAPTDKNFRADQIPLMLRNSIDCGFEGLILRQAHMPYQPGVRSSSLIKIKEFIDDDYEVKDVKASKNGWGILVCVTSDGREFNVSAPGDMMSKYEVLKYKHKYIGKLVNVKYANLTADGIPFHPVAERWIESI